MSEPATIARAIEISATRAPQRGFSFVTGEIDVEVFHSYAEIERISAGLGGAMQALGLEKGDRLALILPENEEFVLTFLAALRVGVIPVPIYPPIGLGQLGGYFDNVRHIIRRSRARALVTSKRIKPLLGAVFSTCRDLRHIVTFNALGQASQPCSPVDIDADDIAFLQFTSGSTSRPKGVVVSHANLLANSRSIIVEGLRADPQRFSAFTWLPLFHDMGLIGFVITLLAFSIRVTFMPTLTFLKRPATWLRGMSHTRADVSFAPNSAYALCLKRIRDRDLDGVDLSNWSFAGCGAEPIRAETLEAFADRFAPYGFRKEAFLPAYGMAESTLAISFGRGIRVDRVKASVLWREGRAEPCGEADEDRARLVACGKAFEGHAIGVFALDDERSERPLPDRVVGELRLRGPSVCQGYYDDPESTRAATAGLWFRTGDLGYLVDGEVYICGRAKEVIIVNGRNFYPQDIEWAAHRVEGVRKGNVVAFGSSGADANREYAVLAFETLSADAADHKRIAREIRATVQETIGLVLDDIVPIAPGALPKTSSGKLQRVKVRQLYESGDLTGRKGARDVDRMEQAKHIAQSQLAYLKLAIFGGKH